MVVVVEKYPRTLKKANNSVRKSISSFLFVAMKT